MKAETKPETCRREIKSSSKYIGEVRKTKNVEAGRIAKKTCENAKFTICLDNK